jgi:hypothetical protein
MNQIRWNIFKRGSIVRYRCPTTHIDNFRRSVKFPRAVSVANTSTTVAVMSQRQQEEFEILVSIYGQEAVCQRYGDENSIANMMIDIKISNGVMLRARLESTYPETSPNLELIGRDIPESFKEFADRYFQEYCQSNLGEVVLFDCVEWVKENFEMTTVQQSVAPVVIDPQDEFVEENFNVEGFDDIYHGEPLIDRKSVFQAHLAPVNSVDEAMNILSTLKSDRKISRATHNMYAYRIVIPSTLPSGEPIQIADNDDDGEDAAGPKLAQLLSLMNAENVIVVVSRWYGGIQLGPDRFRHIANVARIAIEECGGGRAKESSETKKKISQKKSGKRR